MNSPTSKAGLARRTWARISSAAAAVSSDQAAAAAPSGQAAAAALSCICKAAATCLLLLLSPASTCLPSPIDASLPTSNAYLSLHRLALSGRRKVRCRQITRPQFPNKLPGSVQTSLSHHSSACSGRWHRVSPVNYY